MVTFHLQWDPSVSSAPPGFQTTVQQVCSDISAKCPALIDVTLQAGWGTILGGSPLDPGALGESAPNGGILASFVNLRAALLAANTTLVLPTSDPNPTGAPYTVNTAAAKALKLMPNGLGLDGWVGFAATPGVISFDRSNLNGQYDGYSVIYHEITEVLGRSLSCSFNSLEPLDLLHYSAPGQAIYTMIPGYFSMDGGVTSLNTYNTVSGADAGDWRGDTLDPCNAFGTSGVVLNPSQADWDILQALGYMSVGVPPPPPPPPVPTCTLSASPGSLKAPGTVRLSGTTQNATSAFIDNGVGPVSIGSFSVSVPVSVTTRYTLTAVNSIGTNTSSASVSVKKHGRQLVRTHHGQKKSLDK